MVISLVKKKKLSDRHLHFNQQPFESLVAFLSIYSKLVSQRIHFKNDNQNILTAFYFNCLS